MNGATDFSPGTKESVYPLVASLKRGIKRLFSYLGVDNDRFDRFPLCSGTLRSRAIDRRSFNMILIGDEVCLVCSFSFSKYHTDLDD